MKKQLSLRIKLICIVLIVLVPICSILYITSQRMIHNVYNELVKSYQHELNLYGTKLDDELEDIHQRMKDLMSENWFELSKASNSVALTKYVVWTELKNDRKNYDYLDLAFLKTEWDNDVIITHDILVISLEEKEEIQSYLRGTDLTKFQPLQFNYICVNGNSYLLNVCNYREYSFGVLVRVDRIIDQIKNMQNDITESIFFADLNGNILSSSDSGNIDLSQVQQVVTIGNQKNKSYVLVRQSSVMDYCLIRVIPTDVINASLPQFERLLQIISLMGVLLIPILFISINRLVVKPLNILNHAMKEIENENLQYRITKEANSAEFQYMNTRFNKMVAQIQDLKIETYEKDIEKLKMESVNLRLQINPHLLLNSLNMIYSLAQSKKHMLITKYTKYLMDYFRYSLRKNDELVTIQEEMKFVADYLEIQKIRFPNAFFSVYDIDEELYEALIPPLLIENFVENCMKYALKMGDTIEIVILIKKMDNNMIISIIDTGNGMSEETLRKIRLGEAIVDRTGNHIGILNCRRRLELFFGKEVELKFTSVLGAGTQIWMSIPCKYKSIVSEEM